ncbi:MAG: transketolase [Flexibacter sp. CG_4_10_14_3_um_filter_32_15]|nr:MAG: transketolase [Flexibacter sp. CG_4_10_14_3_um_filter_32_15]PJB18751.1 MAG: transketolase [Flavobacteriaceae bacterium CG_4_9_14_3_um_filter_33_16]
MTSYKKNDKEFLQNMVAQVRRDIVRMVHQVNSGHPGGSLGCAELFVALYFEIMEHNPSFDMDGKNEDLFFLSNGHISPVWYSVLARSGYFDVNDLATFRKINSRLQGHPATEEGLEGIRIASGSLGQGLSVAIGAALSKKMNKDNKTIFVLMGDGEQQEGQVWEAAIFAAHQKVDNLIAIIDANGRQIDGDVKDVMNLGDLKGVEEKYKAFGWNVLTCQNGNDFDKLIPIIRQAKDLTGNEKPTMILMKTEMGHGVDYMMGTHKWHGVAPNDEQLEVALAQNESTYSDY